MVGAIARHPVATTFAVSTLALGAANALAPQHDLVRAANTAGMLGGAGAGLVASNPTTASIGWAIAGASLIGHIIGRQSD